GWCLVLLKTNVKLPWPTRVYYITVNKLVDPASSHMLVSEIKPGWCLVLLKTNVKLPWPTRVYYITVNKLVDPASSHMLVSEIKPCMSKYIP
ncbi:hypothetical protein D0S45_20665, partial [Marinifilum sp. JC120]